MMEASEVTLTREGWMFVEEALERQTVYDPI